MEEQEVQYETDELVEVPDDEAIESVGIGEEQKPKASRLDYTQWLRRGDSMFIPTDNATTVDRVDCGVYNLKTSPAIPFYLYKKNASSRQAYANPFKRER